ncbi:hypothetical protein NP233_g7033 [Leucocoprinus birnbaumii]|uniref:3-oxoacyl-[acyl-carrier-protein] reductase n=1 Tax=Leucocoprinus birnbaumii TaxID=56174 RepID=A0AAD5VT94_9AGAR|nr:hypothetical protein NP233_g7033 [Leucocoprinus birnbaumii]
MPFSPGTAHLPDGNHLFYTDSGPVEGAVTYTSVILIHGHAFNGHVFEPLHEIAAQYCLRLFAINRKQFAGSSVFSHTEINELRNGDPIFLDHLTVLLGHLTEHLIKEHHLPPPNAERTTGGIMILGWSLGCAVANTLLSNSRLFHPEQYDVLRRYIMKLVLYDPPLVAFGFGAPLGGQALPGDSLQDFYETFKITVGSYFDQPNDWDGDPAKLPPQPSSKPATTASWAQELLVKIYEPKSAAVSDWPLAAGPIQTSIRRLTDRAFFDKGCVAETFPEIDVLYISFGVDTALTLDPIPRLTRTNGYSSKQMSTRIVLITGGAQGIGKAIALRLARDGCDIAIDDVPSKSTELESVAKEIQGLGRKVIILTYDVTKEESVKEMVEKTVAAFGQLDIMVANAGIGPKKLLPVAEADLSAWEALWDVNIRGVVHCYKYAAQQMIKQGTSGRIIGASSLCGLRGYALLGDYFFMNARLGADHLVYLALELKDNNITVNAYAPGIIDTPMARGDAAKASPDSGDPLAPLKSILRMPEAKIGQGDDVANLVSYLASPGAQHVTELDKSEMTQVYQTMPTKSSAAAKNPMKPSDASRIQSTQAKAGNPTGSNSFPARAQSSAAANLNRGVANPSGGNITNGGTTRIPKTATSSSKGAGAD